MDGLLAALDRLPPASTDAQICSFECIFCSDGVERVPHGMCPNCGGGFVARPVRPARGWPLGNHLGRYPAFTRTIFKPVDTATQATLVAQVGQVPPEKR